MTKNQEVCRPREHLQELAMEYRGIWKIIDMLRAGKGEDLPDWPDWCFCPMSGAAAIVSAKNGMSFLSVADISRIAALSAWRVGQGVYRFDPSLYEAILDTPIKGELPCDILYRLPEWCVYIETPGMKFFSDGPLYGFFAHLEWDVKIKRPELRLLLDSEKGFIPVPLHIGPWTLLEAVTKANETAAINARENSLPLRLANKAEISALTKFYEPLLSLLLYLCEENAEIRSATIGPIRPSSKRTKKSGIRFFPPDKQRTWDVGVRIGAALRQYAQIKQNNTTGTHLHPRPHIRRAHWHTYKIGVDRSGSVLKWLPPISVNIDDIDALPSTVKNVA